MNRRAILVFLVIAAMALGVMPITAFCSAPDHGPGSVVPLFEGVDI
jgi:hypothetical protein